MLLLGLVVFMTSAVLSGAAPAPDPSLACREQPRCGKGACTDHDGRCAPGSDAECRLGWACAGDGSACRYADWLEDCIPAEHCAIAPGCAVAGFCAGDADASEPEAPACRPTAKGCAASVRCRYYGACAFDGGDACVARPADCQHSALCKFEGACGYAQGSGPSGGGCATTPRGCEESVLCRWFGLCAESPNGGCEADADACKRSLVCSELGWCSPPGERPAAGLFDGHRYAPCHAEVCGDTAMCKRWGACTPDSRGGCVVGSQQGPMCELHRVLGLTATATTAREPEDGHRYGAGELVDRDARTAWVAAEGKGARERITIRLAKPERVARVWVRNTHELQDPRRDQLSRYFGRILHAVVHVGDRVEMFYDIRPSADGPPIAHDKGPFGIPVVVPPTLTDTITLDIDVVAPGYVRAEPAITEVVVEACGAAAATPPAPSE